MANKTMKTAIVIIAVLTGGICYVLEKYIRGWFVPLLPVPVFAFVLYRVCRKEMIMHLRPGTATALLIAALLVPVTVYHIILLIEAGAGHIPLNGQVTLARLGRFAAMCIVNGFILWGMMYYKDKRPKGSRI